MQTFSIFSKKVKLNIIQIDLNLCSYFNVLKFIPLCASYFLVLGASGWPGDARCAHHHHLGGSDINTVVQLAIFNVYI
jgi:hypothetical protein